MVKNSEILLVDKYDKITGCGEKMEIHRKGLLHRAFSIFVFNSKGELMLQKREKSKYHSGGLWTNTCCGHPGKDESIKNAAMRRLYEEMGFTCELKEIFSFVYKVKLNEELFEHEYDHVFVGNYDNAPRPDSSEVMDWRWSDLSEIQKDLSVHQDKYTYWFLQCFEKVKYFYKNKV